MIKHILEDINIAMENKAYLSAIALALTIPDICGKIQDNGKTDKKRYINWFNEWVKPYFEIPMEGELSGKADFNGNICYALRCAYLHSGNLDLNGKHQTSIDRFELCLSSGYLQSGDSYGCYRTDGKVIEVHRRVNIINLLNGLVQGASDFIEQYGDSSQEYGSIKIIQF